MFDKLFWMYVSPMNKLLGIIKKVINIYRIYFMQNMLHVTYIVRFVKEYVVIQPFKIPI